MLHSLSTHQYFISIVTACNFLSIALGEYSYCNRNTDNTYGRVGNEKPTQQKQVDLLFCNATSNENQFATGYHFS